MTVRYRRPAGDRFVVEHLPDGTSAVFDQLGDVVHSLSPTAAAVWACCQEPASAEDISAAMNANASGSVAPSAIDSALRQLAGAGLVQQTSDVSGPVPLSSRRAMLKRLGWSSAAAAAAPVVMTLLGSEQRVLAESCGSPLVNLQGCWSGGVEQDPALWLLELTQSGNTISGTLTIPNVSLTGPVTGSVCGNTVTLNFTLTDGTCDVTSGNISSTNATAVAFSGPASVIFGPNCGGNSNVHGSATVSFTKGCVG